MEFTTDYDSSAFFFIRLPLAEAEARYKAIEIPDKKPLNTDKGIEFGFVNGWAVFQDYSPDYNQLFGSFDFYEDDFPIFFKMAQDKEAIFAMYETDQTSSILYAMKDGKILYPSIT